jgi:isochorismate synthase EntC
MTVEEQIYPSQNTDSDDLAQKLANGDSSFWSKFFNSGFFIKFDVDKWCLGIELSSDSPTSIVHFKNFFDPEVSHFSATNLVYLNSSQLLQGLEKYKVENINEVNNKLSSKSFSPPSFELFSQSFQNIQGKIQRDEIDKAVPMATWRSSLSPSLDDRLSWMSCLINASPHVYPFGFWNEGRGILGATPEILFQFKEQKLKSMALAGTALPEEKEKLLKDPKEMREHNLVVRDIENILNRWGRVKKNGPTILDLPHLSHILTELEIETSSDLWSTQNFNINEIIQYLHPTPALGVAPRSYGYQWMRELSDQHDRGLFGGPIIFKISENEVLGIVAIRAIRWDNEKTLVSAGCGVVKSSQLKKEWSEINSKANSIFKTLGISE